MISEPKEAFQKTEQLNNKEQSSLAKMIGEELKWENALNNTQNKLSLLAKKAIEAYEPGKTKTREG